MSVRRKPALCNLCPYERVGGGFVPDLWGPPDLADPRLAVWLEAPGHDEALLCEPMVGRAGRFWERALLRPIGLTRSDVIIANTLRCRPPGNQYPSGWVRSKTEATCRQYDYFHGEQGTLQPRGIADWDPQVFIITYHPAAILRERAFYRLALADFERAARFMEKWRTCILCGDKAASIVFPQVARGGVESWRGHVFYSSLKGRVPLSRDGEPRKKGKR